MDKGQIEKSQEYAGEYFDRLMLVVSDIVSETGAFGHEKFIGLMQANATLLTGIIVTASKNIKSPQRKEMFFNDMWMIVEQIFNDAIKRELGHDNEV
jgi:hypothetical protein